MHYPAPILSTHRICVMRAIFTPHRPPACAYRPSGHVDVAVRVGPGLAADDRVRELAPDLGADLRVRRRADDVEQRVLLVRRQV